jgi:hypothetical protein
MDFLFSVSFGAYIGYAIQLSADSGGKYPEKLMGSTIVGLCSFLLAFISAALIGLKFKALPSWLLLSALGPLFCVIGLIGWRSQTLAVGPDLVLVFYIVIPFFFLLLSTRVTALFLLYLIGKYHSLHPKVLDSARNN